MSLVRRSIERMGPPEGHRVWLSQVSVGKREEGVAMLTYDHRWRSS